MVDPDFMAALSPILGEDVAAGLAAMAPGRTCIGRSNGWSPLKPFPGNKRHLVRKCREGLKDGASPIMRCEAERNFLNHW